MIPIILHAGATRQVYPRLDGQCQLESLAAALSYAAPSVGDFPGRLF
jgi:hypothetical protein